MNQTDSRCFWIDQVNRAAVGDINAQHHPTLIGNKSVAGGEFTGSRAMTTAIDNCDLVPMNLLGRKYGPIDDAYSIPNFPVRCIKPLQHFDFIMQHIDAWNS